MVVGETQMGAVQITSNVIHFDSSVPTATIQFANNQDNQTSMIVTNYNPIILDAIVNQNDSPITSSNDIQVTYQYQLNNGQ
ncbi:hypothetical protein J6P04_03380 [bacterium]|nr:hypothetical protein [bacterium]